MKRFFLLIISFIFLGSAISGSAFLISSSLNAVETNQGLLTSENGNLDSVTANAPTNDGYWTDAGNYADSFAGGTGTEADPYLIETPEQLARLAYLINSSTPSNSTNRSLYYEQTADLDMSAYWWDAIGTSSYYFAGHYNGGGYTISGLYTESGSSSTYSYQGLFGYVTGSSSNPAEIYDVGIIDSNIQGYERVGGIVGDYGSITSTIVNCYNSGNVISSSDYVGGIVGGAYTGVDIANCYNTGSVSGYGRVGGIFGGVYYLAETSNISNCYNVGSVSGTDMRIGGIVGSASGLTIINCYNTGYITSSSRYVGGIIAYTFESTITNCYNAGSLNASETVGGIVGYTSSDSIIANNFNIGSVNGVETDELGGIVGYSYDSRLYNCFWGGDCLLTSAIGYAYRTNPINCGSCTTTDVRSLDWYNNSSNWYASYLWDFSEVWLIMANQNNGYPMLKTLLRPDNNMYWTDEGNYADSFAGGNGAENNPYLIETPEQLARLAYLVNDASTNSQYASLYYEQTANLDMSEFWWDAIGTSSYYFSGYYDGGGFIISGLYTESGTTGDYSYQGLFGYAQGVSDNYAEIHDTAVADSVIQGYQYVGGIVGYSQFCEIYNCHNAGTITSTNNYIAGIAGYVNNYNTIYDCYNEGEISGSQYVGGIAGLSYSSVENCYNTGTITAELYNAGGIVGYFYNNSTIKDCYNEGELVGNMYIGGIVGFIGINCTILDSYNIGTVTAELYVGGLVGTSSGIIYDCYNEGVVRANTYSAGGIIGISSSGEVYQCYNSGEITSGSQYVGGIIGISSTDKVYSCYNDGIITAGSQYAGGLVGTSTSGEIYDSYNVGDVTILSGPTTVTNYCGGIIGNSDATNIHNCYNAGNVECPYGAGGVAGNIRNLSTITNCFNVGTTVSSNSAGAIVGVNESSSQGSVAYTYWGGNCTLTNGIGSGVTDQISNSGNCSVDDVKNINWYSNTSNWDASYPWDFEEVWAFMSGENNGYPVLRAFYIVSITFNANGGQGVMEEIEVYIGQTISLPTCTLTRTGHEFAGWATSSTGAVVYADGASITPLSDMTLYAVWRAEVYEITLDWNGGSGSLITIYFKYGGSNFYSDETCLNAISESSLSGYGVHTGFTFTSFTTNADGSGTVMYQNGAYMNTTTILADDVWYAQWQANNEAKYDSEGGYWYIENGAIPQTKVTDSTLISALNSATTTGSTYYIAGLNLQSRVYNGTEYCQWNGNWYEVEPIRWRLTFSSNQTDGYGTTTATNAVLAEIVYVGQFSTTELGAGEGYSSSAVSDFMQNGISTEFLSTYTTSTQTFGNGATLYGSNVNVSSNMFISSESEINSVAETTAVEFSNLVKDIIKSYGGANTYFTRDLGSNYNNITCFNGAGIDSQRFATEYRGVQFTVCFTEYGCVA